MYNPHQSLRKKRLRVTCARHGAWVLKLKDLFLLLLLTLGALLVHGYHPWAEDAEIYVPGIEKILNPELFPFNSQFFASHAHLTLFPNLIADSVRLSHLPLDVGLFVWQATSIFLLLLACWHLISKCFADRGARWAGVATIAALLTLPVAGTALYIMDPYINPRNLVAFAAIFAIAKVAEGKYFQAALFLAFAAAIHPLMSVFVLSYCAVLVSIKQFDLRSASRACLLPLGISFEPSSPAYHQVALAHSYFYLLRWHWYEWLGAVAPIAILWWFSRIARSRQLHTLDQMCRALMVYQPIYLAAALLTSIPARFESLGRLQFMRSLYIVYVLLFLFAGSLLGEYVLKNRVGRWIMLFAPICIAMFLAQRAEFPRSAHIEWPWARPKNLWVQAFEWIRGNTREDAVFALDPFHMNIAGEDANGFRAIAQRSMLADANKDSGAVSMFPQMAEEWHTQIQAQSGWASFQAQDFRRLHIEYGVSWVVLEQPGTAGLDCPYQNASVRVCRLN
jgi:hypothetical protein